jgi:hypothetical protein
VARAMLMSNTKHIHLSGLAISPADPTFVLSFVLCRQIRSGYQQYALRQYSYLESYIVLVDE